MILSLSSTFIDGIVIATSTRFQDNRGFFYRAFCDENLRSLLKEKSIRQANISKTYTVGTIRGLHFQYPPAAEIKFIRCLKGKVWDVAVDLRCNSSTFLQWYGLELSAEDNQMLVIPEGCAHGFQVLEPNSELLYLHTMAYVKEFEGGVCYNDPLLEIAWPLAVTEISKRDLSHPSLSQDFTGIIV